MIKTYTAAQTGMFDEIFVDNFAGGGGASTGIELAVGRPVDIAINHDPAAIAMHKVNHPYTQHYCESVWDVNPVEVCRGHDVALAWFSPDCKHFSKAKGGKPVNKNIRGLAWIVLRWAGTVRPRVIILENVEEFQTWGPVRRGKPVKSKSGQTFEKWKSQLISLGYKVEHRELKACDYGAPTIRKRFFLIARCDGKPIIWPEPTHGDPKSQEVKSGKLKPWRTAAEIIDWSIPCSSIFSRKKALAENTLRRIARGLQKFVIDNPEPYIIQVNHSGDGFRGQAVDEPLQTITAKHGYGIVTPVITKFQQKSLGQSPKQPLDTVMAGATRFGVITPTLIEVGYGEAKGHLPRVPGLNKPLGTVVASKKHALVSNFLTEYYGNAQDGISVNDPLHTSTSKDREAVTMAFMSKYFAGGYKGKGNSVEEPLNTVTTTDHNALAACHLEVLRNHASGQNVNEPMNTICTSPGHFAAIKTYLVQWDGKQSLYYWPEIRYLLNKYCGCDIKDNEILIFEINGILYFISDIGLRMLEPRELYAAQGFPPDYKIEFDINGKKYSKSAQVARCGNSVPPPFAEALVRANLPEYATSEPIVTMSKLLDHVAV